MELQLFKFKFQLTVNPFFQEEMQKNISRSFREKLRVNIIQQKSNFLCDMTPSVIQKLPKFRSSRQTSIFLYNQQINKDDLFNEASTIVIRESQSYVEQFRQIICALANESQGGVIIIADQVQGNKLKKGFALFETTKFRTLRDRLTESIKTIVNNELIQIKVDEVPIKSFYSFLTNEPASQFVIRITVDTLPRSSSDSPYFFVQHQLIASFRESYLFYKLGVDSAHECLSVSNILADEAYCDYTSKIRQRMKKKKMITFTKPNESQIIFNIGFLINVSLQPPQDSNKTFIFSNKREELLMSCCKIFYENSFEKQFEGVSPKQTAIVLQIGENFPQHLAKIEQLFLKREIPYHFFFPLPNFQYQINKFILSGFHQTGNVFVGYFFFEQPEAGTDILQQINILGHKAQKLSNSTSIGSLISGEQLQVYLSLIWQKFVFVPKIVRKSVGSLMNIEIQIPKSDQSIALYTYTLFSLVRMRPTFNKPDDI